MAQLGSSIAAVIQKVKDGVYAAMQDERFDDQFKIAKLELTLLTSATTRVSGSTGGILAAFMPLLNLSAQASVSEANIQTISLVLEHQEPRAYRGIQAHGEYYPENIDEQLKEAILAIVDGIRQAGREPVALAFAEASVELHFDLTSAGGISIVFADAERANLKTHTLKLHITRR